MGCSKYRYVVAFLACAGMAIIYGIKVNLSVAIVAMVNHTALAEMSMHSHGIEKRSAALEDDTTLLDDPGDDDDDDGALICQIVTANSSDEAPKEDGPFLWSEPEQGLILGSYFWGYFVTQVPGGRLSELYSAKWVFFVATALNVVSCLASPVASVISPYFLVVFRVLEGLGAGVTFPAMNVLISKWAPNDERSAITAIILGGCSLGTVASIPSAGLIAGLLSWEWIFYIHGGLAVIWLLMWALMVSDTPADNRYISADEVAHIEQSLQGRSRQKRKRPVPWCRIATSLPVWTIIVTHTCNNVGWYMLLVELPLFMRTGLGLSIAENAILSSLPFLGNWVFSIIYGNRIDWAQSKGYISTTWARKISVATSSFLPALCLVGVALSKCDKEAVITFMVVATTLYGAMYSGFLSNHTDIASNYGGVLMGISNMSATIPGFVIPSLVGFLTHGTPGLGPWHVIFYGTAFMLVVECLVFTLLGTSQEQDWNRYGDDPNDELKQDADKVQTGDVEGEAV